MIDFLQLAVNGIMVGSIYGLVAMGFVLIYKSTQVFNLAQGELVALGAYTAMALIMNVGLPGWVGVLGVLALGVILGLTLERFPLRPLTGQPLFAIIMVTLGISMFFKGLMTLLWGSIWQRFPSIIPNHIFNVAGISISSLKLIGFLLAMAVLGAFTLFFRHTKLGLGMRATCEDEQVVQSFGVNVNFIIAAVWAFSILVSVIGGIILGMTKGNVGPLTIEIGMKAIPAALLGGLESIPGAMIGGLVIGLASSFSAGYIGAGLDTVVPFILMVIVVLIKPYGLFGLAEIERI